MKLYWAVLAAVIVLAWHIQLSIPPDERAATHAMETCYNWHMVGLPNLCSESITAHQSPPATPQQ